MMLFFAEREEEILEIPRTPSPEYLTAGRLADGRSKHGSHWTIPWPNSGGSTQKRAENHRPVAVRFSSGGNLWVTYSRKSRFAIERRLLP